MQKDKEVAFERSEALKIRFDQFLVEIKKAHLTNLAFEA